MKPKAGKPKIKDAKDKEVKEAKPPKESEAKTE